MTTAFAAEDTGTWPAVDAPEEVRSAARERRTSELRAARARCVAAAVKLEAAIASGRVPTPPTVPSTPPRSEPVRRSSLASSVLLVENDEEFAETLREAIEAIGLYVKRVARGYQACDLLAHGWDVVVVDVDLGPGCYGTAVVREFAEHSPATRRVLVSDIDRELLATTAANCGAHAWYARGDDSSALVTAIRGSEDSR